jgi:hypothetical protein
MIGSLKVVAIFFLLPPTVLTGRLARLATLGIGAVPLLSGIPGIGTEENRAVQAPALLDSRDHGLLTSGANDHANGGSRKENTSGRNKKEEKLMRMFRKKT